MSPWLITTMACPAVTASLVRATLRLVADPVTVAACAGLLALGGAVALIGRGRERWGRRSTS